ncbi:MAG: D-tyrosyl-tRNA(Tyr) deacylase [Pleopsidium flavum]|nr:MAG: D-tyrosyl-tRNA(Tyr) deacylase [Pleopsidium flavum]
MKAVLQRVASASVTVDKQLVSSIGRGVLVFAAVAAEDTQKEVEAMAGKVLKLKMWPSESGGTFICSGSKAYKTSMVKCFAVSIIIVLEVSRDEGRINTHMLVKVSQFTLLASTKKGSKPDFHRAAGHEKAKELYDLFYSKVQEMYTPEKVKNGVFQAMMEVGLVNDGPVGVDYRCEDGAVTMEIQTNPPKASDNEQSSPKEARNDLYDGLPASLLE